MIPRRWWYPTPVLLPRKSHGQRSLVGCSPWGRKESDTTEWLHFSVSCIGEGNGNPLQCSCLENPRDRGAWWAAVYGVAQSRTRLKRLSSSRCMILWIAMDSFQCTWVCLIRFNVCVSYHCLHVRACCMLSPLGSAVHGIPRQEYWSGLPFPPPEDLPNLGITCTSLMPPALVRRFFITELPEKPFFSEKNLLRSRYVAVLFGHIPCIWAFRLFPNPPGRKQCCTDHPCP